MPLMLSKGIQVGLPTMTFADNATARHEYFVWEEEIGNSTSSASPSASSPRSRRGTTPSTRSPTKVAAALAAGCTVVLKPSEVAPINAFLLADIIHEVGLPKGVFNLVTGARAGRRRGDRRRTPRPTWSPSPARRARASGSWQLAAEMVKRVSLELGGKSANVILEDADICARPSPTASSSATSTPARPARR